MPVGSVITSRNACAPSGSADVSKDSVPLVLGLHGTAPLNGGTQFPPLASTTVDATTCPSASSNAW